MTTKTAFFGTIFAFNSDGVNDVIQDFRNGYSDTSEDAPFMSYDFNNHVFKIDKLELLDEVTPVEVLRQLQQYTQEHSRRNDVLEPKIQAREGFLARLATDYGDIRTSDLLDLDLDDPEEASADAIASLQQSSIEWKPVCGNIHILTRDVAVSIANLTGTSILMEPTQNIVRLVQGDFRLALQKLNNLEPLLKFQYEQRDSSVSKRRGNLLLTTDTAMKPLMGFQKIDFDLCPAYQRVIVPPRAALHLSTKYICEGRVFQDGKKAPHPNLNPMNISATDRLGKTAIWDRYAFKETGSSANKKERPAGGAGPSSEVSAVPRIHRQNYLQPTRAAELQGWSANITPGVDPNNIEPEDPPTEATSRRRRRVAVDSDEEDDSPSAPLAAFHDRTLHIDSEIGSSQSDKNSLSSNARAHLQQHTNGHSGTFDDDGQLLEGLPYDGDARPLSPVPSALPSNLMSMTSESSPNASSSAPYHSRPGDHSSPASQISAALRMPNTVADSDNMPSSRPLVRSRGGKAIGSRGGSVNGARSTASSMRPPPGLGFPTESTLSQPTSQFDVQWSSLLGTSGEPEIDASVLESFRPRASPVVDETSKQWVNTKRVGINADARREDAIHRMQQQIDRQNTASATANSSRGNWANIASRGNRQRRSRGGQQQRKADDQQPHYHNTMGQQARNPGKRGGKVSQSSPAKRQQILDQAYGSSGSVASRLAPSKGPSYSEMSASKQKLLATNKVMASSNSDAVQQGLREEEGTALKAQLEPLFEHTRAFSGKLDFGIYFGQVLLPTDPHTNKTKNFGMKLWNQTFGPDAGFKTPLTFFTPILTSNGADIDRALRMKPNSVDGGSTKLFDQSSPGPSSITFEFHCESKNGETFLIDVREDLTYDIRNSTDSLGTVCMHCPAQVWDACAMLQGAEYWKNPPPEMRNTVKMFIDGIHIPTGHDLIMYFRQPPGNVLTIKNLIMKRVSLHDCLLPGHEDVLLRVTEHMTLSTRNAPHDKKLCMAIEPEHDRLFQEDALHYEMCLVDKSINAAFEANHDLEIGSLTDHAETGISLLQQGRIQRLLELTVSVLTNIDYIGRHNIGTMIRLNQQRMRQEQSLPPGLQSQLNMPASRLPSVRQGTATSISGSQTGVDMPRPVHGVRMNTVAEVARDEQGAWYQRGLGGARVYLARATDALEAISEDLVLPEDSASQFGGATVSMGGRDGGVAGQRYGSAVAWSPVDDKPQGYW